MQESIKLILKKFKEHDPFQFKSNKENCYKNQGRSRDYSQGKQQVQQLLRRVRGLQSNIDSLVTDGNKVIKYFQEQSRELINQNQQLREQFANYKLNVSQERKQLQGTISELTNEIEKLNGEINAKSIQVHEMLEKCEDYEENASELRKQEEKAIQFMRTRLSNEAIKIQQKWLGAEAELEQKRQRLEQVVRENEEMEEEIVSLKKLVDDLVQENLFLKEQYLGEGEGQKESGRARSANYSLYLQQCEVESISNKGEHFTLEQMQKNDSREMAQNQVKSVLNISEHYSKCNRTDQFQSKQKSNYFYMMNSNQSKPERAEQNMGKSFVRRRGYTPVQQNNTGLVKIMTIESDKSVVQLCKSKDIKQIKEFKMGETVPEQINVDPYRAFFMLMTQCEKMNSPHFNQILNLELTSLYDSCLRRCVPYNLWQAEIKKALESAVRGNGW